MGSSVTSQLRAVLFDRDGTLVVDVPYNSDPRMVQPMPGAKGVLDSLRARGLAVGVVSNQSGVARGILTEAEVASVNARVEELLGPFDVWEVCVHGPADGCACRKPAPGMVHSACRRLGIQPAEAGLVGDIGSDVGAAEAAGARGVLVPTRVTRREEITAAKLVAPDLAGAVDLLLGGA
jgi:HAD superfamily hydrolase (TIGR01662 family)